MSGKRLEADEAARKLATVIGENARRLRAAAGLTLDQVSIAAQKRGLNWSESRVADFERGKVAPNLATLIAVCVALADAGCASVGLPELLRSESPIKFNDRLLLSSEQVSNLLGGRPAGESFKLPPSDAVTAAMALMDLSILAGLTKVSGAAEERIRKALAIDTTELANWSVALWDRTFSEERDRRAGVGANAQKRGQVTRQMRAELEDAIRAATHGDDK